MSVWKERDAIARDIGQAAAAITLATMGLTTMAFGHEERVRKSRAVITHTHSETPLTKRQKRRLRGRADKEKGAGQ